MRRCSHCSGSLEAGFRFCPWCGSPQRSKLVEFFRAHPLVAGDRGKSLRVSRYIGPADDERHVRFSVWNDEGRAEAAVSLDDAEAERLARFLVVSIGRAARRPAGTVARVLAGLRG
jgi:hypothetical protein